LNHDGLCVSRVKSCSEN